MVMEKQEIPLFVMALDFKICESTLEQQTLLY